MSDIFNEIDEDLRRDRAKAIWSRYGRYIIAVCVLVVVAAGAFTWWQSYERAQRQAMADQFAATLASVTDKPAAEQAAAFEGFALEATGGYRLLGLMQAAALYGEASDHAAAADIYRSLATQSDADPLYTDLAAILAVAQSAKMEEADPVALLEELSPYMAAESDWRYTALEIAAGLALQAGDQEKARDYLTQIADGEDAPQRNSARASNLLQAIAP